MPASLDLHQWHVAARANFAIDPCNPTWLYSCEWTVSSARRRRRHLDEVDEHLAGWTCPRDTGEVYVSPHDPQALFLHIFGRSTGTGTVGLIQSTDGGAIWNIVTDMEVSRSRCRFDSADASKMVLATPDARVFQSSDGGDT